MRALLSPFLFLSFFSECIQKFLKAGNTECPQCGVKIQGKSLTRNSSYATMVQCITKIRNLINGIPATQKQTVEDQAEILKDVLEGIVGSDTENEETENKMDVDNIEKEKDIEKEVVKIPKPKKAKASVKKSEKADVKVKSDNIKELVVEALKVKKPESSSKKQVSDPTKSVKKVGLLLTGLSEDQKLTIQSNLQQLSKISGGKSTFKIFKDYSPDTVSHIICACASKSYCPRTLKYLLGIAGKAWIVSFDWILESLEAQAILDEQRFVVVGDEAVQCDTNACEKSRADQGKLFDGKRFYLAGLFNAPGPSKADLTNLIQVAGGTVCKKQEEGATVVSNNSNGPKEGEMPYTWLFDAISLYKI